MSQLYPLRFRPLFRRYLWGGRRLQTFLQKPIGEGQDYAESWEIVDHGQDQSVVVAGPLEGKTLGELVADQPEAMLGHHAGVKRFPLLLKFLDCHRALSVQVHPNDQQAARLSPPDLGKTEAWVILHAEPGSVIYAGLKRGFDRAAFEREVARGTTELCLHRFTPRVGDCVFMPAGTVHALGAGLVVAEIQQASDTTFRLYDWGRLGPDGKMRPLHVEQALDVIDYQAGPIMPQIPQRTTDPAIVRLVHCDKFIVDRWTVDSPRPIAADHRCHLLAVLTGEIDMEGDPVAQPLRKGGTTLIPAEVGPVQITPAEETVLLDIYLP